MNEATWVLASAARGYVYGDNMINGILIALLLEWTRYSGLDCYDEKYTPAFLGLTYGELTHKSDVVAYVTRIEREVTGHTGVLDQATDELLGGLELDQARRFFGRAAKAKIEDKDAFFPLMMESMFTSMNFHMADIYGIPSANRLEKVLLEITPEMSFYDGFCGTGIGTAIIAGDCKNVYLQDINQRGVFYTTLSCIFRGIPANNITLGDSFVNQVRPGEHFDRIVLEPPFGTIASREYRGPVAKDSVIFPELEDSESLYLRHALARLSDDGIAVVRAPAGFLYKSNAKAMEARSKLLPYIDTVVFLPGGLGAWGTAVGAALLVLRKNKSGREIYMLDTSDYTTKDKRGERTISDENLAELTKLYRNRSEIENVSTVVTEQQIIDTECNLTPARYVKIVINQEFDIHALRRDLERNATLLKNLNEIEQQLSAMRNNID